MALNKSNLQSKIMNLKSKMKKKPKSSDVNKYASALAPNGRKNKSKGMPSY